MKIKYKYKTETMKRLMICVIVLLIVSCYELYSYSIFNRNDALSEDSLIVMSSPDLLNVTKKWQEEFNKTNSAFKIKVIDIAGTKMTDNILSKGGLGFVTSRNYPDFESQSLLRIVIGRDIIVPVVNSKNRYLSRISEQGVSADDLLSFLSSSEFENWGTLLKNEERTKATYYWFKDESISEGLKSFLNTDKIFNSGVEVKNIESFISAIKADRDAIGFCKLVNVIDYKNQDLADGVTLLPIDRNGNGVLDYNEEIYKDMNIFSRAVWIGKFPRTLFSNIYSVTSAIPRNSAELTFLKWVMSDGQEFLYNSGYSELLVSERQSAIDKLNSPATYAVDSAEENSLFKAALFIIAAIILTGFFIDLAVRLVRKRKKLIKVSSSDIHSTLDEHSVLIPGGIYFDKTHTWAFMEQNGIVKVGIDDFLQHITGPLSRIRMKSKGSVVKKGEEIVSIIQNGKQLNLYSPVSGKITEQNLSLENDASLINSSPYENGWVYKIEPSNWQRENQILFMAEKHIVYVKNEISRLKDFLAETLKDDDVKYAQIVLQDGGELKDGILADLGPKVWDDFQTNFIDSSRITWFYEIF